jgi:hypothetical protein
LFFVDPRAADWQQREFILGLNQGTRQCSHVFGVGVVRQIAVLRGDFAAI